MSFTRAATLAFMAADFVQAQNEPPFKNIKDPTKYKLNDEDAVVTPTFNAQLIYPYAPYNTDQNSMKIEYYSDYDPFKDELTFHVKLIAKIEINTVGSNVYMFLGFFDPVTAKWDYLKCSVDYDGDVNANSDPPSRLYTVTDHISLRKPQDGALDQDIPQDNWQDWEVE